MGKVWAARAASPRPVRRLVAIKTALGEAMANPEFERLFMDEARIASLIQHPNVCGIQGLDEEGGITYLVMDWSDGATLRELLDGSPEQKIDNLAAARIVADVCAGLHAAHELRGEDGEPLHVVHRDVSPQNILIAAAGHVRIADFGVAKARGQLHRPTETGEMKGKLSYMAPEQVTTKDLDRRVDVFALGCVLYEATLGMRPFHGEDALSTLYQLLEQALIVPSAIDPAYPQGLERIVVRALAKEPNERYQTAEAMQHDLHAWMASSKRVVTERAVAEVLHHILGKRIAERHALIQQAIEQLDAPASSREGPGREADLVTVEPSIRSVNSPGPGPGRRRYAWGAALLATVSGALATAWLTQPEPSGAAAAQAKGQDAREPATPKPSAVSTTSAQVAEPTRVVLTLRAEPENAVIRLDNGPPLANPYEATVAIDPEPHLLEVSAPGYETRRESVSFDRNQEIVVALNKVTPPVERRPTEAPRRQGISKPQPSPTALDAGAAEARRPLRKLDEENPF